MTFELMQSAHIPEVAAIEREAMDSPWNENMLRSELENANSRILVGVDEWGGVICYGGFRQALDEADILNVAVKRELRGRGIGKLLMSALTDEARRAGVAKLTLEVRDDNAAAIALYTSFGFKQVGVRKRYYLDRFDALVMALEL